MKVFPLFVIYFSAIDLTFAGSWETPSYVELVAKTEIILKCRIKRIDDSNKLFFDVIEVLKGQNKSKVIQITQTGLTAHHIKFNKNSIYVLFLKYSTNQLIPAFPIFSLEVQQIPEFNLIKSINEFSYKVDLTQLTELLEYENSVMQMLNNNKVNNLPEFIRLSSYHFANQTKAESAQFSKYEKYLWSKIDINGGAVSVEAISALVQVNSSNSINVIRNVLNTDDLEIRNVCFKYMSKIPSTEWSNYLCRFISQDTNSSEPVFASLTEAIVENQSDALRQCLYDAINAGNYSWCETIGAMGGRSTVEFLISKLSQNKNSEAQKTDIILGIWAVLSNSNFRNEDWITVNSLLTDKGRNKFILWWANNKSKFKKHYVNPVRSKNSA